MDHNLGAAFGYRMVNNVEGLRSWSSPASCSPDADCLDFVEGMPKFGRGFCELCAAASARQEELRRSLARSGSIWRHTCHADHSGAVDGNEQHARRCRLGGFAEGFAKAGNSEHVHARSVGAHPGFQCRGFIKASRKGYIIILRALHFCARGCRHACMYTDT